MVMHRGSRLAVYPGDWAALHYVDLQVRVHPCELPKHAVVSVPVTTSDLAPNVFGECDRLKTRQRTDDCVKAVSEVVFAMGSVVCPVTRTSSVYLGVQCDECQLPRSQAVAGRTIHTHRSGYCPIHRRDQAISAGLTSAKNLSVGSEFSDGSGETTTENIGCVDLVSHRQCVLTQTIVEYAVRVGERHYWPSVSAPRRSRSWALKVLRLR
jgi:hypothetical protein